MADGSILQQMYAGPVLETNRDIVQLANKTGATILAFVAPHQGLKVSPIARINPSIGNAEEFAVETFINCLKPEHRKNLYLVVDSPGGGMDSSYKVARVLRMSFEDITVFVPHVAASGGTFISLTGDRIIMGAMSNLTPVDVQLKYKGTQISANNFMASFNRFVEMFATSLPEETPHPLKAMVDKLDPIMIEEMTGVVRTGMDYVTEILKMAKYDPKKIEGMVEFLVTRAGYHGKVLTREILSEKGFRVEPETSRLEEWKIVRSWIRSCSVTPSAFHHLKYCVPAHIKTGDLPNGATSTSPSEAAGNEATPTTATEPVRVGKVRKRVRPPQRRNAR